MATGKISRLPREIREQVNQKLVAGEPGNRLVAWLNELPAVQALLTAEFGGAAINEQNLTNWKQSGLRDWRMEQEVAGWGRINAEGRRAQSNGEGEETFNAEHSTLNVQGDGKFVEPQIHPIEGQSTVTVEQLSTIVAVRYLAAVREWQLSPVSAERRWRQMRVILQDVMKLRRQEQREQRMELDWEWLQLAQERFEEGKQSDVRRVMTAFLAAARQWPEVGEALATAFGMLQERKRGEIEGNKAELEPIKVNQAEHFFESVEAQDKVEDRGWYPRPCRVGARRSELAGQRLVLPVVGGIRMDEDLAKLKPIKVDQGDIFFMEREKPGARMRKTTRMRMIRYRYGMARQDMRKTTSHPCAMAPPEAQARLDSTLRMSFN
jgi:hypothetical protein